MTKRKAVKKAKQKSYVQSPNKTKSVRRVLRGSGYKFDSYNGRSVGVQGDGRVYGPVAIIAARGHASIQQAGALATLIINETPGITRVLLDITPKK